jgi:apolipoprotein D and lipocalin family protein
VIKHLSRISRLLASGLMCLCLLQACSSLAENVAVVDQFELERYLGSWYEIARLDHSFERDMRNVTAHYSMMDDGGVRVANQGFKQKKREWKESIGKAYFVDRQDLGQLKVSFFGPFYGGYNIIALDKDEYAWALVAGPNTSYLWVLSRTPELDPEIYKSLVDIASNAGFPVDQLIEVPQSPAPLCD